MQTGRCFRCLAAGHQSRDCPNTRRCGVDGCESNRHSSYLHERDQTQSSEHRQTSQLRPEASPFSQQQHGRTEQLAASYPSVGNDHGPVPESTQPRVKTHTTSHVEHVSLMVLPALISNGKKALKANVMLDPCSTGSHVTEAAAEELALRGRPQTLRIAGTGGAEVTRRSRRVEFTVLSSESDFASNLEANVLDNITSDKPAVEWAELKKGMATFEYDTLPESGQAPTDRRANRK